MGSLLSSTLSIPPTVVESLAESPIECWSRSFRGSLTLSTTMKDGSSSFTVPVILVEVEDDACDVAIVPYDKTVNREQRRAELDYNIVNIMEQSILYGWFQGECIIGLQRNADNRTGSFCLEQLSGRTEHVRQMIKATATNS